MACLDKTTVLFKTKQQFCLGQDNSLVWPQREGMLYLGMKQQQEMLLL